MSFIYVEVTAENAKEVLARKNSGENICPKCVKQAFEIVIGRVLSSEL
jgi:hypothetical protein